MTHPCPTCSHCGEACLFCPHFVDAVGYPALDLVKDVRRCQIDEDAMYLAQGSLE